MAYTTIDDPSEYFQTALYTGNATQRNITNDGNSDLQPDWVWIKCRSAVESNMLYDSTRGVTKDLRTDGTNAENTNAQGLQTFNSDGFQIGTLQNVNYNSQTLVAWQWKANGGTTASNTDGTITSTVQANLTAGFNIVTYTGTGSNATVGHGLGAVPDMVIVKRTSTTDNWGVQLANALGNTNALRLNLTDAYGGSDGALWWNDTSPTSTTVSIGTRSEVNTNTSTYVMYCFKNIQGYSRIGKYIGNGSADGTFVYTGFKPAWVMAKRTDSANSWVVLDNKRNTSNAVTNYIQPNATDVEGTSGLDIDFLSNGFKWRTTSAAINANSGTNIYMAFAERPFVTPTGTPTTAR